MKGSEEMGVKVGKVGIEERDRFLKVFKMGEEKDGLRFGEER
ncbi:hypothetical protein [Staphylococcus saprophyticus]|nr:hypothetical protein [Staphylococcus saprophyticus]